MKLFRIIIAIVFLCNGSLAYGAASMNQTYVISSFEKGQNSHINPFLTPGNQGQEDTNVRINGQFGSLSKRDSLLASLDYGSTAIKSIHRYYKSDGTIKTIVSTSTLLRSDFSGTATTIKTGLSDGKKWQFVTYQDVAIGGNDTDLPIKYDGHTLTTANTDGARTASELCAELGAPFAELNTGTNLDASSWYMYKVAFYDDSTYDYSTARSNPILTGAAVYDIALTDIPIGPTGTTARYVYRTLGNASQAAVEADTTYYWVATISDNSTTTLADTVTDATADDDAAPTWATVSAGTNATPPIAPIWTIHNERLFAGGNTTYKSRLYWSDEYNPDHFDPVDFEDIRPDDGDEITFIKNQKGLLQIGKTTTIQRFYTDASSDSSWYVSDPFSFIGCPAPYSVANTPLGIFYLSRHGIYNHNGQTSQLVSDAITDLITDISQVNIETTVGYYHDNKYRLSYISTDSEGSTNNREAIYDLIRDAYVLDTKNINCYASFNSGTDTGTLYSGSSTTDGYVFSHTAGSPLLVKRYKSQFDLGTFDDARVRGTETAPIVELAWDCTVDGWLAELQTKDASINTINDIVTYIADATIDRPDTDGTWTSPVYTITSDGLDKLYWNETLNTYGDVTFQARTGNVGTVDGTWTAWSTAVTDPTGSDMSSSPAANTYIQFKINLSTTDIDYTPTLQSSDGYAFKLTYDEVGSDYETTMLSTYKHGWTNFGVKSHRKMLKRIKVFYTGTSGTMNFNYKNDQGDIDVTFTFDMSILADDDTTDFYTGADTRKIYTYYVPSNSVTDPMPIGQWWLFTLTESGIEPWQIDRIEVLYDIEEFYE